MNMQLPLYDIPLKTIDGRAVSMEAYRGLVALVVNVASRCGYTPQYVGLEALYRRHRDQGFVILGFPCDQFGHQEPGSDAAIRQFCSERYDVTFPMFAKIDVNGTGAHPLFNYLKSEKAGLLGPSIKWNFTKFLVDRSGKVVARHAPTAKPEGLAKEIEALL